MSKRDGKGRGQGPRATVPGISFVSDASDGGTRSTSLRNDVDDSSRPIEPLMAPTETGSSSVASLPTLQTQTSTSSSSIEAEARLRASRMEKGGSRGPRATRPGAVNSQQGLSGDSTGVNEAEAIGAVRVSGMTANRATGSGTLVVSGNVQGQSTESSVDTGNYNDVAGSVTATAVSRDDLENDVRRQIMEETIVAEVVPVNSKQPPPESAEPQRKSGSILLLAAVCLIVIGGAIVGVVVAVVGEFGYPDNINGVLLQFLSQHAPAVTTYDSAQYRALRWLSFNEFTPLSPLLLETFALVTFYYSTDGPNWIVNDFWLDADYPVCQWYPGSICDRPQSGEPIVDRKLRRLDEESEHVLALDLMNNNLRGTIPSEIALLSNLDSLLLHGNEGLTGTIPSEIGLISNLEDFFAGRTSLTGTIPTELGDLEYLKSLHLSHSTLRGTIPEGVWSADRIKNLYLEGIGLTGSLPASKRSPEGAYVAYNNLTGTIPIPDSGEWGGQLNDLDLSHNQLSGTIPEALYRLWEDKLEVLRLEGNQFSGVVPEAVCSSFEAILDGLNGTEHDGYEFVVDCNGDDSVCGCCTLCCTDGNSCS